MALAHGPVRRVVLLMSACLRSVAHEMGKILLLPAAPHTHWRSTHYELRRAAGIEAFGSGRRCASERAWDGNLPPSLAWRDYGTREALGAVTAAAGDGERTVDFGDGGAFTLAERPYAHVSDRLWDAALVLALYVRSRRTHERPLNIVEIGAGLGVPSIDLARTTPHTVTATDGRRECVAHLRANAACAPRLAVAEFEFGSPATAFLRSADLVIGSDVCYSRDHVQPLVALLAATRPPLALIAAPTTRSAVYALAAGLLGAGAALEEERFALLSAAADDDDGPGDDRAASHFRVLAVRWPASPDGAEP